MDKKIDKYDIEAETEGVALRALRLYQIILPKRKQGLKSVNVPRKKLLREIKF